MRAPEFWRHDGLTAHLLAPLGSAFAAVARLRHDVSRPFHAPIPVICIGNLVAGGAGKTPVAMSVARHLSAIGANPHLVTRGYGGREAGPLRVEPGRHDFNAVGDEPLLLAAVAPTWVARDRAAGTRAAAGAGAGAVVLDDGLQNPGLAKDLSLVVVDGGYGFGNGRPMPAGPLREHAGRGLGRADAAVVMGTDSVGIAERLGARLPVLHARVVPVAGADALAGRDVVAFAGIGRPEKFFETLREIGCRIVASRAFPDHHQFTEHEIMGLIEDAAASGAAPVTTAKDAARLTPEARAMVEVLDIAVEWRDPEMLESLLAAFGPDRRMAAHG